MGVNITGLKSLQAELEKRFGQAKMQEISDQALFEGAQVIKKELEQNFESFRDISLFTINDFISSVRENAPFDCEVVFGTKKIIV